MERRGSAPRKKKTCALLIAGLLASGGVACRADESAETAPPATAPAPRLKLQSYQNYETSERGTQLAVTPHLSWQLTDDLELTAGPTFYSYLSPVFHNPADTMFPGWGPPFRAGIDHTDYGAALGYYHDVHRASLGVAGGLQSVENPYLGIRNRYVTGTLSAGYRLTHRMSLFGELYRNGSLGGATMAGLARHEDAVTFAQPGQTILTLGARGTLRENESLSLSVSAAPHQGPWLRFGAIFRY
jgi:hypothetical protein